MCSPPYLPTPVSPFHGEPVQSDIKQLTRNGLAGKHSAAEIREQITKWVDGGSRKVGLDAEQTAKRAEFASRLLTDDAISGFQQSHLLYQKHIDDAIEAEYETARKKLGMDEHAAEAHVRRWIESVDDRLLVPLSPFGKGLWVKRADTALSLAKKGFMADDDPRLLQAMARWKNMSPKQVIGGVADALKAG